MKHTVEDTSQVPNIHWSWAIFSRNTVLDGFTHLQHIVYCDILWDWLSGIFFLKSFKHLFSFKILNHYNATNFTFSNLKNIFQLHDIWMINKFQRFSLGFEALLHKIWITIKFFSQVDFAIVVIFLFDLQKTLILPEPKGLSPTCLYLDGKKL